MYREYRDMPVGNRICMNATRDRAYQRHLEAIKKTKATINTSSPPVPKTIGRNMKRYENEKQRNEEIAKVNKKLCADLDNIYHRTSKVNSPQTHFTLRGSYQTDQMERIDRENRKLVEALLNQKPNINRVDLYMHNCDHLYQVNKMSIHKKTIPMSKIMRQKLPPMDDTNSMHDKNKAPTKHDEKNKQKESTDSARDNLFLTNKENVDKLLQNKDESNGQLQDLVQGNAEALTGDGNEKKEENENNDEEESSQENNDEDGNENDEEESNQENNDEEDDVDNNSTDDDNNENNGNNPLDDIIQGNTSALTS